MNFNTSSSSTENLRSITLTNDAKFEEELNCALETDMKSLVNFDPTLTSFKVCTFWDPFG